MPPRKQKSAAPIGLTARELVGASPPAAIAALIDRVTRDGGAAIAPYREPLGGHWVLLAALPLEKIAPTPFQRELSDSHTKRLATVIPKVGRFLDPVIAIAGDDGFWTPNGMHRLAAMRRLGARAITALVVPEVELAYRILALNTEKAHNLKDKALEVARMADRLASLADHKGQPESTWAFEFEEPAYLTIGQAYLERPRYSGGAYLPAIKRCERFLDEPIAKTVKLRAARAQRLLELDDHVIACVAALKARGLKSAYLKPFVVARVNPLRFVASKPGKPAAAADFDETVATMIARAKKFDAAKVKPEDLASAASFGAAADE